MGNTTQAQSHAEPPPYVDIANANFDKRSSFAESLPEYTAKSKDAATVPPKDPTRRRAVWILFVSFIIIAAVIGGTLGGILGRKHSLSGHNSSPTSTPISMGYYNTPDFLALAAAECDEVTFVVYQKNNTGMYLRGELKTGTYSETSSPVIPEQQLHVTQENFAATGTNITAVCQQTSNSSAVDLYFYYVAGNYGLYRILEANVNFPDPSQATPNLAPNINTVVANMEYVPAITSVLLPPSSIRLFYLEPTYNIYNSAIGVWETDRSNSTAWSPPSLVPNTAVYNRNAAITASAVNISSAPAEVHLLYMNSDNVLSRRTWNESGWNTNSSTIFGQNAATLVNIPGMTSIVQSVNPTMLRLYYIQQLHVHQASISVESNSWEDDGVINSQTYSLFPVVTMNPGLISATSSGLNSTSNMAQVFFVRASYNWNPIGPKTAILNASVPVDGATWSVSTLGQDPNSPPDSTMQMPN